MLSASSLLIVPDLNDPAAPSQFPRLGWQARRVTLFGVAIIVFVVIRVVPGNPIAMMLPPGATEEDIAKATSPLRVRQKSIFEQFVPSGLAMCV